MGLPCRIDMDFLECDAKTPIGVNLQLMWRKQDPCARPPGHHLIISRPHMFNISQNEIHRSQSFSPLEIIVYVQTLKKQTMPLSCWEENTDIKR